MFNNAPYNAQLFNFAPPVVIPESGSITFNGYNLMTACSDPNGIGIAVQTENSRDLVNIDLSTFDNGQTDGGGVLNRRYTSRTLNMTLTFVENSYDELVALLDDFKKNTSGVEGLLEILDGGIIRTAKATIISFKPGSMKQSEGFVLDVPVVFQILDPNWAEKGLIINEYPGISANLLESIVNSGSYITYPSFVITFQAGTVDITDVTILINNVPIGVTGQNINGANQLYFDGVNKQVLLNGTAIDYDGFFQELDTGVNSFEVQFIGTSVLCDIANLYSNILL